MSKIRGFHAEVIKDRFKKILTEKGYAFFDGNKPYNLNLIGIRNANGCPNQFDDIFLAVYRDNHKRWLVDSYQLTTDPGFYWMRHPMNVNGTAILCPDQYRGVYKLDGHGKTRYEALCQRGGEVTVWRDADRDTHHDMDDSTKETGWFGINIHKAGRRNSSVVEKWSAGCQVFKNRSDFEEVMATARKSRDRFGNSFTYTLLESTDL